MGRKEADLIIHPARLRILQILSRRPVLSTKEIAAEMPDVPESSIYRHLRKLLQGSLVRVEEERTVRGTQEKLYALDEKPELSAEDAASWNQQDHIRSFTAFSATLIQDFSFYIQHAVDLDMAGDRTCYSAMEIYATNGEWDEFGKAFSEVVLKLASNKPEPDRRLRKLVLISHPLKRGGESDG